MWQKYIIPASIEEAISALADGNLETRVIAGGTDLLLEMDRGQKRGIKSLVDISRLPELAEI